MPAKTERTGQTQEQLYTLEVFLLSGPITKAFARRNKVVSRTIQIKGDQTLADLHEAIFDAFDRQEEHMYEFHFGKGPHDPQGKRYVLPAAMEGPFGEDDAAGIVTRTSMDSLGLKNDQAFGYWFDFGDDWFHQINVVAVSPDVPKRKYPRVTNRVGESPPQYA